MAGKKHLEKGRKMQASNASRVESTLNIVVCYVRCVFFVACACSCAARSHRYRRSSGVWFFRLREKVALTVFFFFGEGKENFG